MTLVTRIRVTAKADLIISEFQRASRLTGAITRVARKLALTPSHVRQVAIGNRISDRVMRELIAETSRIERKNRERAA